MKRTGPRDTIAADLNARLTTGPLSALLSETNSPPGPGNRMLLEPVGMYVIFHDLVMLSPWEGEFGG